MTVMTFAPSPFPTILGVGIAVRIPVGIVVAHRAVVVERPGSGSAAHLGVTRRLRAQKVEVLGTGAEDTR